MKIEYKAKLRGQLHFFDDSVYIGDTEIRTILPEHFADDNIVEVEVKVYEVEK